MSEREKWVKVRSESELCVGMVVRIDATYPRQSFRTMLLRFLPNKIHGVTWDGRLDGTYGPGWAIAPAILGYPRLGHATAEYGIQRGRLFRLETNLEADESNPYFVGIPVKESEKAGI